MSRADGDVHCSVPNALSERSPFGQTLPSSYAPKAVVPGVQP